MVGRAKDGRVGHNRRVLYARNPIDSGLLTVLMDVLHQGRDVGKRRDVWDGPAIGVKTPLPARVNINVAETVRLQSRGPKRIGLGSDIGLRQKTGIDGLLAECAPAEVWPLPDFIHLRDRFLWSNKLAAERESNHERCCDIPFPGYWLSVFRVLRADEN